MLKIHEKKDELTTKLTDWKKSGDAIVKRWGPRALVSLAFAMTAARLYPTVKYALGHGKACSRVVVGGAPVALDERRPAPRESVARMA